MRIGQQYPKKSEAYKRSQLLHLAVKSTPLILLFSLLIVIARSSVFAQTPPGGFTSRTISSQWNQAVGLCFNSDGSQMFVWERTGKVYVVENNQKKIFVDISEEVGSYGDLGLLGFALHPNFESNGYFYLLYNVDRHYLTKFGTSAYSSTTNENNATIGRLTRYTASRSESGYQVNVSSRKILIGATKTTGIPSVQNIHGVGSLVFGRDGTLLISAGDAASNNPGINNETYIALAKSDGIITPEENVGAFRAQLLESYNGKILRVDPETGNGISSNPFFEPGNPYSIRSKVYALGLRNPFRLVLKPGTGSTNPTDGNPGILYAGDVGHQTYEEVDIITRPGMNFGWPIYEGLTLHPSYPDIKIPNYHAPNPLYGINGCNQPYFNFQDLIKQENASGSASFTNPCNTSQAIPSSIKTFVHSRPIIDWKHDNAGPSRTGTFNGQTATVTDIGAADSPVSGSQFGGNSSTAGLFYTHDDFPDIYKDKFFFGDYVGGWIRSITVNSSEKPVAVTNFINSGAIVVCMAINPTQNGIYYVNYPSEIRRVTYNSVNNEPNAVASADKLNGTSPLTVQFTGNKSTDPEGQTLTYAWNFGDGTTSTEANPSHTFTSDTPIKYTVTLTVTDTQGATDNATLTISINNNTPPQVTITSPVNNTQYPLTGETTYNLRATVTDLEQSSTSLAYRWQTILHHGDHEHAEPFDTNPETTTTLDPVGCDGDTYYYRVILTVTDDDGLTGQDEVRLYPNCNTAGQRVTSYELINADTDAEIESLHDGSIVDLAELGTKNINIRAVTFPATVGSVILNLTGKQSHNQTESSAPYALFGRNGNDYNAWAPATGNYNLTAKPYSGENGSGTVGTELSINFSIVNGTSSQTLVEYYLVNADTERDIQLVTNGATINLAALPTKNLNVRATTNPSVVGSVVFKVSGQQTLTRTENTAPYAVFGESNGNYTAWVPAVGNYTILGTPYSGSNSSGTVGSPLSVSFSVINQPSSTSYSLTVNASNGTVTKNPNQTSYDNGTNVTLTATPAVGYQFSGWSGNATGTTNPLIVNMNSNKNITANFTPASTFYTLTVNTSGNGTVSKSPNQTSYASGSTVTLTATPASGYQFSGWSGAATGSTNPLVVTMNGNKNVTATFTQSSGGQQVVSFTLINASNEQPIRNLVNNDVINIATLKTLNIRANTNPAKVGSVKMALTGPQTKNTTETGAPYALFGDVSGNYNSWTPAVGSYTLTATPSSAGGSGTVGAALVITFSVVNQSFALASASNLTEAELANDGLRVNYFPNPFTQELTLQLQNNKQAFLPIKLVDLYGRVLLINEATKVKQTITIGKEVCPGVYILIIGNGRKAKRYKVIKTS
ncbi:InlB B-repeat-containing protein [Adhaeribacter arboris]|uniref:InlB B-repeat-containing protein n=1 Tax=Adhaeribacter arboris TaxID=2072846 RepID=UPI0013048C29|nr:PQQ-dependent sugar dehydrogenase [Adhaeribacter arboris]